MKRSSTWITRRANAVAVPSEELAATSSRRIDPGMRARLETAQFELETRYAKLSAAAGTAAQQERERLRRRLHEVAAILAGAWQHLAADPATALASWLEA
jgi:hypothetical protein